MQAYYPTKKLAASTYTVLNLDMMSDADRRRVTVMLINPDVDHPQKLTDSLGGEWKRVDELISGSHKRVSTAGLTPSISYHLVALRRVK